jgi:NitT/TauT family transport system substrate-binding protein
MRIRTLIFGSFIAFASAFTGPAEADPVHLEVGYIPILASTPLFIIQAEGWAQKEGLDLHLTKFEAGTAAIQALAAGKVDVIYAGIGPVLVARGGGVPVSVVAASAVEELALVARGDLAEYRRTLPAAQAIEKLWSDKKRKVRIATQPPGSVPDTVLRYWLMKVAKINADNVELVSMGIENTQQALLANAIDAAMIREPTITIIQDQDPKAAVLALGDAMFPTQPGTVVAVRGPIIAEHRDAVAKLVHLQVQAVDLIHHDSARAARDAHEFIGKGLIELPVLERAIVSPSSKFVADPHSIVEATQRMLSFQSELGIAGTTVPVGQGFDFSFFDSSNR